MQTLAFIDNYKRIRAQFFAPAPARVVIALPPPIKPIWDAGRTIYAEPIGPESLIIYPRPIGPPHIMNSTKRARFIIKNFATFNNLTVEELLAHRRAPKVVKIRHEAVALVAKSTMLSLPEMGRLFGGRDHTSILYAIRKMARLEAEARQ